MKKVRKAVRTFLIDNEKIVVIKYTSGNQIDYYDIPGGKIEEDETSKEAAIREFKEETGIDIINPKYAGNLIVEYPDRIYDFDVFTVSEYDGILKETDENIAEWIDIDKLLNESKKFAVVTLLDEYHISELRNNKNFKWHFISDENHNKVDQIFYHVKEPFWSEYLG